MCDATRQALIALLIEQALKAGRSDCGCEDRIQVNLAPSELPDAAPELVVTIFEAKGTADELERLVKLRDAGVLSPEEFEAAKQKVLFGSAQDGQDGQGGQDGNGDAAGQPLTDGISANALTQQMLNSFEELKARLSTTDVELISIAQLDVPPPPSAPPLCAMPPVPEALTMKLSERARKGSKILKLDSQQCGLEEGMELTIGAGDTMETVTISGFGSILLLEPLRNTHAAGTSVEFLPTSPPASPVAAVEEEVKGPGPAEGGDSAVSGDKGDEEAFMITMIVTLVLLFILACCCCCGWYLLCVAVNRKKAADEKALQEPSKHDDVQVELAEENSERWSLIALDKLAKVSGSFKNFGPPPPDRRKLSKKPQSPGKAGSEPSIKEEGSTWSGPNQA